jgi:hypothetical protein
MKSGYTVTVQVPDDLTGFTDVYLASLWHLSQVNPAPFGDPDACKFAEKVGREIIRRFVTNVGPDLWNHQGVHIATNKRIEEGATA